jgi:hypothetical protein
MLAAIYFPNGGIMDLMSSRDSKARDTASRRISFCQMLFRNVISTLCQCLLVGEQMMCEEDVMNRTWSDIDHSKSPAKFTTKVRKALLNEQCKEPVGEMHVSTGNRHPDNKDRVECRNNLLACLDDGKVKGTIQDLNSLSTIIFDHIWSERSISPNLSPSERKLIVAQWDDIVGKLRDEINVEVDKAKLLASESGEIFIDPRNVVPCVDTSGSMEYSSVQHIAIGLGILASQLSTIPGALIAFSENPSVYHLDMSKDVFDHFVAIVNGPTGLSTDIDKTYDCMLGLMRDSGVKSTDFAIVYLTDGQFNSSVVKAGSDIDRTALGRMATRFNDAGFNLPRTCFWNLVSRSPGFSASATSPGVQLVSGYSQELMHQLFTGDYEYIKQADGTMRVNVDPWTSFEKAILNEGYDPVVAVLAAVGEGCFASLR